MVRVFKNGRVVGESSSDAAMGNPFEALAWLANDRVKRGEAVKAGMVVTTGTRLPPIEIQGGDQITIEFVELGKVGAAFN
jgi:2-oxopent-4-enoate/cis-2-oxohex-4-enoate hydratase